MSSMAGCLYGCQSYMGIIIARACACFIKTLALTNVIDDTTRHDTTRHGPTSRNQWQGTIFSGQRWPKNCRNCSGFYKSILFNTIRLRDFFAHFLSKFDQKTQVYFGNWEIIFVFYDYILSFLSSKFDAVMISRFLSDHKNVVLHAN